MLTKGNTKLGEDIFSFNLPVGETCPGASELCAELCYGKRGHCVMPNTLESVFRNFRRANEPRFIESILDEISRQMMRIVRIHSLGDFFRETYIRNWRKIVQSRRPTKFYAYTRSWAVPDLLIELRKLAVEPNMILYLSCDKTMPKPPKVPGTRLAWLAINDEDIPPFPVDLVFRNHPKTAMRKMSGYQVCPYEQKIERKVKMTCSRCKICHAAARKPHFSLM